MRKFNSKRNTTKSFAGIPRKVMDTEDYIKLSGNAIKALNELCYQYRGNNNGDLQAAWSLMQKRGFNSQTTLSRAVRQLLKAGLIVRSREGRFLNPGATCALYALTWESIDECNGRHDLTSTNTPIRKEFIKHHHPI
jgi:hypothetical protein